MSQSSAQHRAEDRFASRRLAGLQTQLLTLQGESVGVVDCELSDISVGGCAVRTRLDRDANMTVAILRLRDPASELELEVAGKLCWQQQTSVGSNTFGFRFRRNLDSELINQMIERGLVTRRQDDRLIFGKAIQVRRAHGQAAINAASLDDCSTTGVRLTVDVPPQVNERLLLTMPSGVSGSVSAVWVTSQGARFQCGCTFLNLQSARAIHDEVTHQQVPV